MTGYDVVVVGGRVAGASTALLLARAGARVALVDRSAHGSDTLSTHGLMRAGVLQLSRWGLLDRVVAARTRVAEGGWLRGLGWREGDWTEAPTREALDRAVPDIPVALMSKDYHSLWLSSAALARAGGDLEVSGGVVERDDAGEPTGILREESAWRFRDRHVVVSEDELVEATRAGIKLANARGVAAIHDKDGWLGAHAIFARIHGRDGLTLRVWQSLPHDHVGELAELVGLSQPATSQQLGVLRDAGLVTTRPDGNRRLYRVDVERLAELRAELDQLWSGALSGLKAAAEAEHQRRKRLS